MSHDMIITIRTTMVAVVVMTMLEYAKTNGMPFYLRGPFAICGGLVVGLVLIMFGMK